jgi:hypothetical protein
MSTAIALNNTWVLFMASRSASDVDMADNTKLNYWNEQESNRSLPFIPSARADALRPMYGNVWCHPHGYPWIQWFRLLPFQIGWRMASSYDWADDRRANRGWFLRTTRRMASRMALADGYVQTQDNVQIQENKPLHLIQDFLAFLALPLKSNIGFQGEHANYRWKRTINAGHENVWHFDTSLTGESPTSRHMSLNMFSLVTTSPTSLQLTFYDKDNSNYWGYVLLMLSKMPIIMIHNIPSSPLLSSKLNAFYNFWSLEQWSLYKIFCFVFTSFIAAFSKIWDIHISFM